MRVFKDLLLSLGAFALIASLGYFMMAQIANTWVPDPHYRIEENR